MPPSRRMIARRLRRCRPRPSNRWHLDEVLVRIAGERMYLWRAVDHEGEVLDMLAQRRRDDRAALRQGRRLRSRAKPSAIRLQRHLPRVPLIVVFQTAKLRRGVQMFRERVGEAIAIVEPGRMSPRRAPMTMRRMAKFLI